MRAEGTAGTATAGRAPGPEDAGNRGSAALKWVNAGPDDGALHALLDRVTERVPHERIDVLWIFPPRTAGGIESTVIVVAAFDEEPDRRTVATAHFKVTRDKRGSATVTLQMQEHGTAPVGATQRVVDGVLRRLGDEVGSQAPRRAEIAGDDAAWAALYEEVGGEMTDAEAEATAAADGPAEDTTAPEVAAKSGAPVEAADGAEVVAEAVEARTGAEVAAEAGAPEIASDSIVADSPHSATGTAGNVPE